MIRRNFARALPAVLAACALAGAGTAAAFSPDTQPVSKVEPEFPREAVQANADSGVVKARLTIDGAGEVSRVEIVDAKPRRVFDRAVVKALSQWRFNSGKPDRAVEIDIVFKR